MRETTIRIIRILIKTNYINNNNNNNNGDIALKKIKIKKKD